jgi:hypothetical protein
MAFATIDVTKGISGVLPSANATYTSLRKNAKPLIINGDMQVAQRSTSVTSLTSSGEVQTVDRIKNEITNIGTYTVIQESLTSGEAYNNGFRKAWRIDCTSADASPAASDNLYVTYHFEGQDLQLFKKGTSNAQKFTLAFWIKSNKTGTGQVNLRDNDNSRLIGGTYTISSADTWEHKVVNFAADTTGAFDNDNAGSMDIEWWLDSGTTYSSGATPTAWEAFSQADRNASGNLQIARNTANDWAITGIQLEIGEFSSTTLPPFQFEDFGDNLARCHRYCYVMGASANAEDQGQITIGSGLVRSSGSAKFTDICGTYPQPLRTLPSVTQVGGDLADLFCYKDDGTSADPTSISVGRNTISLILTNNMGTSSGLSAGDATFQQCVEDDTDLVFDAEL